MLLLSLSYLQIMDNNHILGYQYLGFMSFIIIIINLFKKPNKNVILLRQENKKQRKKIKEYHKKKKKELRTEIKKMKQNNFAAVNVDNAKSEVEGVIEDVDAEDAEGVDDAEGEDVGGVDGDENINLKATSKILSVDEKMQLLDESLWDENW